MLRPELYDIWSVSKSSNRILLQPFDSVFVSCELIETVIYGIEWPLRVAMLFQYPSPYPFKDGNSWRKRMFELFDTRWH